MDSLQAIRDLKSIITNFVYELPYEFHTEGPITQTFKKLGNIRKISLSGKIVRSASSSH